MIYLLNEQFKPISEPLEGFESMIWHDKFFECGDWELHAPFSISEATYIYDNHYGYTGIIEGLEKHDIEHVYTGRFLKALLYNKVIHRTVHFYNTSAEFIAKRLVELFAGQNIKIEPSKGRGKKADTLQVTGDNLMTYTDNLLKESGLSGKIELDFETLTLTYKVVEGIDNTTKAPMAKEFENIYDAVYTNDVKEFKNYAYVAGEEKTGKPRTIVTVDFRKGNEEKRELWVDARDLQSETEVDGKNVVLTPTQYKQALVQRGKEKLMEHAANEVVNIDPRDSYDIGEKRTFKDGHLITEQMITEKMVAYEEGRVKETVVFGLQDVVI